MPNTYTFKEIANVLKVPRTTIYTYVRDHLESLAHHISENDENTRVIDQIGLNKITEYYNSKRSYKDCLQTAPEQTADTHTKQADNDKIIAFLEKHNTFLQDQLNKALEVQAEERSRTDTIIMSLTQKIEVLKLEHASQKEPEKKESKPYCYSEYTKTGDDLMNQKLQNNQKDKNDKVKISGIKRFLLEIFNPVALRNS